MSNENSKSVEHAPPSFQLAVGSSLCVLHAIPIAFNPPGGRSRQQRSVPKRGLRRDGCYSQLSFRFADRIRRRFISRRPSSRLVQADSASAKICSLPITVANRLPIFSCPGGPSHLPGSPLPFK